MIDANRYGPWALVAGASEGLGAAFARELAKAGINLIMIARGESPLRQQADAVRAASGVQVRALPLDLSRPDMLERIREVTEDLEVGLVVYNAALGTGPFLAAPLEDSLGAVRLNCLGQVSLAHHFGSRMVQRGRGGLVLVGSLAGNAGGATTVVYGASKAFSQLFAEGLWSEWSPSGVDVLYVVVGAVNTPNRARQGLKDNPNMIVVEPEEVAREALDHIASGPVLVPAHLAEGFHHFSSLPRREAAETMTRLLRSFDQ